VNQASQWASWSFSYPQAWCSTAWDREGSFCFSYQWKFQRDSSWTFCKHF